jgi:broad specificity phosphatase PhoE
MGGWEGRTWESLTVEDPDAVNAYWADYVDAVPPGGESWRACHARVSRWWDAAAADWPDGSVVTIVTHVGVIRALLCHFLGLPPGEALRFAPGVATHTEVLVAEAGVVIEALGERLARVAPHAPATISG